MTTKNGSTKKPPLIIIAGPTATGKSDLSIRLAKAIGGEIISADSIQVYRYMDIGSAKVLPEEMQGIPHYLVDEIDPADEYNVTIFQKKAKEAIETITAHGKIPIVCGGTGFYIQALLYDIDFTPNEDNGEIRKALETQAETEEGCRQLFDRLVSVDPVSAERIGPQNLKRIIRALEFFELTGTQISVHNDTEREKAPAFDVLFYVLTDERSTLYEKIDKRVDRMMEAGLVDEVQELLTKGYNPGLVSMQGLGYKEMVAYLRGELSLEEAIYIIKRDTRHFAKRQITWFKREPMVQWMDKSVLSTDEILSHILCDIEKKDWKHE